MRELFLVGAGGFLGSALRFAATSSLQAWTGGALPYGTLFVNVTGAFLLGVLMEYLAVGGSLSPQLRLFFGVGVLGGYTTFSTLAYEGVRLTEGPGYGLALLYAFGSVVLGLAAVAAGIGAVKALS